MQGGHGAVGAKKRQKSLAPFRILSPRFFI